MKIYKVVPLPGKVVVKPKDSMTSAFNYLAEMIAQESVGGWELVSSMPINVVTKKRRLRTLEENYNALVFAKEASEEDIKENQKTMSAETKTRKDKKNKKDKKSEVSDENDSKTADASQPVEQIASVSDNLTEEDKKEEA